MSKDKSNPLLDKELEELFEACEKGELEKVKSLVGQNPDLVNAQETREGYTALHAAAYSGQTEIVGFLIDSKADLNKGDKQGRTPVHIAAAISNDNPETLELLLNRGAKIDTQTTEYGNRHC